MLTIEALLAASRVHETRGELVLLRRDFSDVVYLMAKNLSEAGASALVVHFTSFNGKAPYFSAGKRVLREAAISTSALDGALRKRIVKAWRS